MPRAFRTAVTELALPVGLIALWWIISAWHSSLYVPSLSTIVHTLTSSAFLHQMPGALASSGRNFAIGMALALVIGIAAGLILGSVPLFYAACYPLLEIWRAVPAVAVLPLAMLFFGLGDTMKVVVIAFAAVWPILLNTIDGVRSIEPTVRATLECYHVRRRDAMLRIVLPAISPRIVAGVRTSLSIGIAVIVISEMAGSTSGIGYFILESQRTYSFPQMWAGAIVLGLVGYLVNLGFRGVEKVVLGPHGPSIAGQS
jgi:ABC-type nitrate/sulfonate/bicarbonate transport system permease component